MTGHTFGQDELERMLTHELHDRADGLGGAGFGFADVKGRAGRIRRNRRLAAGAGVAAALAVVIPTVMTLTGSVDPQRDIQPAPSPDAPLEIARTTLAVDGLERGDAPAVEYFTEAGVVLPGKGEQPLPDSLQALVPSPADGGWLALGPSRDELRYLQEDFSGNGSDPATGLVTTVDRSRFATVMTVGGEQTLFVRSTTDRSVGQAWDFPELPYLEVVDFVAKDTVLYQTAADGAVQSIGLAVDGADGGPVTREIPGDYVKAISADEVNGLVAVQTETHQDASGCFGVIDTRGDLGTPIWETCDNSLGEFSPSGRFVLASTPYGDAYGIPGVDVLDARTGSLVSRFSQASNTHIGLLNVVWESDDTFLAVAAEGQTFRVLRFGVDGTLEEATVPIRGEAFADAPLYFGRDRVRGY